MIYFDAGKYRRTKDGGIYLSYSQIESLTEEILIDYNSKILTYPQAVEYDDFLECYLNVNVDYQHIYTTDSQGDILGCTLFSKQWLPVFDREHMRKTFRLYDPIAVVLDCSLTEGKRKVQENITGLHEGGHVWLHGSMFSDTTGQMKIDDAVSGRVCCRKEGMEAIEQQRCSNAEMWREWQATTFAVTLALPKKSLKLSVSDLFRRYGVSGEQLVTDADRGAYELSYHIIPTELHNLYNMSKEAIRYRLEKTGFYTTKRKYEEDHAQLTFFDFI